MEDADEPLSEAETGRHTSRTANDIIELVRNAIEQLQGESLDEARYRNAGEILVVEEPMTVRVEVPLPYFHHTVVEPESLEELLSPRFPPTVQVSVEIAPPPGEREPDEK
jgi:hypothetical protein